MAHLLRGDQHVQESRVPAGYQRGEPCSVSDVEVNPGHLYCPHIGWGHGEQRWGKDVSGVTVAVTVPIAIYQGVTQSS